MAREEKRVELRMIDETEGLEVPVIRLENDESSEIAKPVRLPTPSEIKKASHRLDVPIVENYEIRTHQPGIEQLIEADKTDPDFLEQTWGDDANRPRSIPWGWFVLIGLILTAGVTWSLIGVKESETKVTETRVETQAALVNEEQQDLEARQLIERMESATRQFFDASSIDALLQNCRQPERVRPLMESYYAGKEIPVGAFKSTFRLQPITLEKHGNFWMEGVLLENGSKHNLLIETLENGQPKIDWETFVCYQPIPWDTFATTRPTGKSFDFRVHIEPDNFFSHEFSDSTQWDCYRLTTRDSDETLFGYIKKGSTLAAQMNDFRKRSRSSKMSLILRVNVPTGVKSRRGVVIEKMVNWNWVFVTPPDPGS